MCVTVMFVYTSVCIVSWHMYVCYVCAGTSVCVVCGLVFMCIMVGVCTGVWVEKDLETKCVDCYVRLLLEILSTSRLEIVQLLYHIVGNFYGYKFSQNRPKFNFRNFCSR